MARDRQYGVTTGGWGGLATAVEANEEDLPHLQAGRVQLEGIHEQVQGFAAEQAVHAASKQEATRRLQALLVEGRKLATFLRVGVRQFYGNGSEKLVEFGLQPFRSRSRTTAPPPPEGNGGTGPDVKPPQPE